MQLVNGAGRLLDGIGHFGSRRLAHAVATGAGLAAGFAGTGFAGIGAVHHLGDAGADFFGGDGNLAGSMGLFGRAGCGLTRYRRQAACGIGPVPGIVFHLAQRTGKASTSWSNEAADAGDFVLARRLARWSGSS